MKHTSLPSALVATDLVIFSLIDNILHVYLRPVENTLYTGLSCLPGALILLHETSDETADRVLQDKTILPHTSVYKEQLFTFSRIDRDKRSRVVSLAYLCAYTGAFREGFVPVTSIKKLAYDHKEILECALDRLVSKLEYTTIIQKLLPKDFTLGELQRAYETILVKPLDKRNFRKKIESLSVIEETGGKKQEGRMRPAALYRFKKSTVSVIQIFS